ncbi:MAG: helix-turn-helix transcriptional regulator, partial [Cyclobacteriaceae bacterium]
THKHYRSTPKMKAILWDIIQCMQSLAIKKIGLEVKALKLLEASLEQMELSVKSARLPAISTEDIVKIQQAKKHLLEHLEQPITLKKLARELGTNTFKLKTGFRSMYGVSVIAYLREARMQKARKLLLESQMPIYLIALEIGYTNSANFTTTFKKRFGYSPRSLRN